MDKKNQIDDIFYKKLGEYEPPYVPEHWQMMKSVLANPGNTAMKTNGKSISDIIIIISAVFLITTGIVAYVALERSRQSDVVSGQLAVGTAASNRKLADQNTTNKNMVLPTETKNLTGQPETQTADQQNNVSGNITSSSVNKPSAKKTKALNNQKSTTPAKKLNKSGINASKTAAAQVQVANNKSDNKVVAEEVPAVVLKSDNQSYVNGVKMDYTNNGEENVTFINTAILTDKEKFYVGYSEEELLAPLSDDVEEQTSVVDDYNANQAKAKEDKKHSNKNKNLLKKNPEAAPDYKVGVVNNIALNPAYTGYNQRHTIAVSTMVYKPLYKPGNNFNVPFGYSFAYDFNFGKRKNCGLGINYQRFIGAAEGIMDVDLTFSYRFNLAKYHNLRVGASLSYYTSGLNSDNLSFPDMIDANHGFVLGTSEAFPGKTSKNSLDMGLGVWYSWKSLYVGVSAMHLTSPNQGIISEYNLPREYVLSAGYNYSLNDYFGMLPVAELRYNEKTFNFSPGMLFTYKKWLLFGTEFRNLKNAGLVLGFNIKDNVIINIRSGIPMSKVLINNFGIIDYAGVNVRLQFGNQR
ncbi:MAG TPA: PorP/SprF family type IX secretion system membrane protein [Bacteroidales bacterium]|nr:PorP/SprF family type IX secretion system membrane protein [Bacteroidales bacterium]